jgi:hypothetical protein
MKFHIIVKNAFFCYFREDDQSFKSPYPGVAPLPYDHENIRKVRQYLYQWYNLILTAMGLLFCVPRYVWKKLENSIIRNLVQGTV